MSKVPNQAPPEDHEARIAALRREFPGYAITPHDTPPLYRAIREGGDDKAIMFGAGTYGALFKQLSHQDEVDCERALLALRRKLEKHSATIIEHDSSLVVRSQTGTARVVGALRGRFVWDSGSYLGLLADVDEVAVKVVRLLGLELHPQLSILARRMAVRGYKVDTAAPEVTVTAIENGTPRALRITCEPRPKDEDRDWFWTHLGDELAEATDIVGAEVKLVGLLAAAT